MLTDDAAMREYLGMPDLAPACECCQLTATTGAVLVLSDEFGEVYRVHALCASTSQVQCRCCGRRAGMQEMTVEHRPPTRIEDEERGTVLCDGTTYLCNDCRDYYASETRALMAVLTLPALLTRRIGS